MKPNHLQTLVLATALSLSLLTQFYLPAGPTIPVTGQRSGTFIPISGQSAAATAAPASLPPFERFVAAVSNGEAGVVRGVYVPGVLALRVAQQPGDNPGFVSAANGVATQFQMAANAGVTGLLAHNFASGGLYFNLAMGQEVRIVYGDGAVRRYRITSIYRYQALEPNSPYSDLVDLSTGVTHSSGDVFNQVYTGGDRVTFQTCIFQDGNSVWGRLFVIATPLN